MARYQDYADHLLKENECTRCSRTFTHAAAINRRQCWYHPGEIEASHKFGVVMSCCGKIPGSLADKYMERPDGCTRADHMDGREAGAATMPWCLPVVLCTALKIDTERNNVTDPAKLAALREQYKDEVADYVDYVFIKSAD
jgi:hypothetical protein